MEKLDSIINDNIKALTDSGYTEFGRTPPDDRQQLPNATRQKEIISLVKDIFFPGFFNETGADANFRKQRLRVQMFELHTLLTEQIRNSLLSFPKQADTAGATLPDSPDIAGALASSFFEKIPKIKCLLCTDVQAMYDNDPAATCREEVILCYPSIQAMIHYRVAHELLLLGVPILPRITTELAHSATGIDIHPGAHIGEYFSIDHGTGVVIGETSIIGRHVHLYKGVTLGARNVVLDESGNPVNTPRHPIIEDNVVIYSNATVLGRITIGHDSVIGGNVWLTGSVPPGSRIVQQKASTVGE